MHLVDVPYIFELDLLAFMKACTPEIASLHSSVRKSYSKLGLESGTWKLSLFCFFADGARARPWSLL